MTRSTVLPPFVEAPAGGGFPAEHPRLRRTRLLTEVFAWITATGVVASVVGAGGPVVPRVVVVVLVSVVLGCWALRPEVDSWRIVAAEALAITVATFVMPSPEPAIGLLFGVTTRRAIRDRLGPRLVRAAPAFAGYVFGVLTVMLGREALPVDPAALAPVLVPLVGLVIGTLALNDTVAAVHTAQAAQRSTVAANERLSAILRASPVPLVLLNVDGTVTMSNSRAREMFGWTGANGQTVPCPHHPNCAECQHGCLTSLLRTKSVEWSYPDADNARTVDVHITEVPELEGTHGTLLAIADISARKDLEDQLRSRVERDQLTGVASRARLADLLQAALAGNRAGHRVDQRADQRPALLLIDLDDFKAINDAHGHPVGDEFLVAAARRIEHAAGRSGAVCRLGGDEFAVLVPHYNEQQTRRVAERILDALAATGPVGGRKVPIRASIGIAVADHDESEDTLLRDADTAMYVAKRAGGHRIQLFHQELRTALLERQQQEADLRQALAENQFVLHYQPIVELATETVTGAEALIRWQHPERGVLPPGPVVELAEETGLIVPLGEWVLTAACRQAVRWAGEGVVIGMSVNVSARQLHVPGFVDTLTRILAETGMKPAGLTLELTESALVQESALDVLRRIRELGVRVALDDFGTGYSSLSYLQRHRFDAIKIDRSFTGTLGRAPTAEGIVRCVVQLASVLDIPVVAEGVETTAQAAYLTSIGCRFAQGYHFGRPMAVEDWPPLEPHTVGTGVQGSPGDRGDTTSL